MGSATREALAASVAVLTVLPGSADLATGEQLLQASRTIADSAALRAALADDSALDSGRTSIIEKVFGSFTPNALTVLRSAVSERWSSETDLVAAIEELGIRALAESVPAGTSLDEELFVFDRAVSSDPGLELAVGSKLGSVAAKIELVDALLAGKASKQTVAIVRQLVEQPRGRRIGELLRFAISVVADQANLSVATVTSAAHVTPAQLERLAAGLTKQYGRGLRINQVVDPALIGGLRVQVGDDVIDGSISNKINDLRLQLAR